MFKIRDLNHNDDPLGFIAPFPSGEPAKIAIKDLESIRFQVISGIDSDETYNYICTFSVVDKLNNVLEAFSIEFDNKEEFDIELSRSQERKVIDYFNNFVEEFPKYDGYSVAYNTAILDYCEKQGMKHFYSYADEKGII